MFTDTNQEATQNVIPPKFDDDEIDFWPEIRDKKENIFLMNEIETKIVNFIEERRVEFINKLVGYALEKGYSFIITPKSLVSKKDGMINDNWLSGLNNVIQIPRYVFVKRPDGSNGGGKADFRKEVSALHILVNFAHEISHLDRMKLEPQIYIQNMPIADDVENRNQVDFTPGLEEEEMNTDMHAYQLLLKLGILISPELFISQIPFNHKLKDYRSKLLQQLKELTI